MSEPIHVIVLGGSVSGLAAALLLGKQGHRVTILERDSTPLPASPLEAFEKWERRGAPQTRHSHAFLARLHNAIRDDFPDLYQRLLDHGAEPLRFTDMAREVFDEPELLPEDDDIVLLACRRITFEWVLRKFALDQGKAEFRDGVEVTGLATGATAEGEIPTVNGVRIREGGAEEQVLAADFVVDATGRRSQLSHWLDEIGAGPLRSDTEPCGIFYSSRFYRLRKGASPPVVQGAIGADLGYMKYGIFQADDRIFSITLAASPEDDAMRRVLREAAFDDAARVIPAVAAWVDPEISEPISEVHGMGKLMNTRRYFVDERAPRALGIFPIGDALIHTNPINGRGCTLGWVGAQLLAKGISEHASDLMALALSVNEGVEREILPWYLAGLMQDRDAIEVDQAQRIGRDPFDQQKEDGTVDPKAYMRSLLRDGLIPGLREDITLLRTFMRLFNLLEEPSNLMANPEVLQKVMASWQRREQRERVVLGPDRDEMVELLKRSAA